MIQKHEIIECIDDIITSNNKKWNIEFLKDLRKLVYIGTEIRTYLGNIVDLTGKNINGDEFLRYKEYYNVFNDTIYTFFDYDVACFIRKDPTENLIGINFSKINGKVYIGSFAFKLEKEKIGKLCYSPVVSITNMSIEEQKEETDRLHILFLLCKKISNVISCKNITCIEHEAPEKLNKKRDKNNKIPIFEYKTLEIKLNNEYIKYNKEYELTGTAPLHLCQGHFKEYTEDKPLFGKITGCYWWQPQIRGKAKNGIIIKDYELKDSYE